VIGVFLVWPYIMLDSHDGIGEGLNAQTIMLPDHRSSDGTPITVSILSYSLIGGLGGPTTTVVVKDAATALTGAFPYLNMYIIILKSAN
jgi:hypothetical protein